MKTNLYWLAVVLLLTTISVPTTLLATDGNPDGPPPRHRILVPDGNPDGPPPRFMVRVPGA